MTKQSLEEILRDKLGNKPHHKPLPPKKKDSSVFWLVSFAIALAIGMVFYANYKNGVEKEKEAASRVEELPVKEQPKVTPISSTELAAIRADIEKLKDGQNKLGERVKWNHDRIALLALQANENAEVIRHGSTNFLYFKRDWSLSRQPMYLELSAEDTEYLKKFIR